MSRNAYTGPKLPRTLLEKVSKAADPRFKQPSRKDVRKAERQSKKAARAQATRKGPSYAESGSRAQVSDGEDFDLSEDAEDVEERPVPRSVKKSGPAVVPKSILKRTLPPASAALPVQPEQGQSASEAIEGSDESDAASDDTLIVSARAAKSGIADDEAEIAALERKLGVKGGKSGAADLDGLDWLAGGSDSDGEATGLKRKRPEDSKWLQDKRLKATSTEVGTGKAVTHDEDEDRDDDEDDESVIVNPFSDDELSGDDFDGLDSDASDAAAPVKRQRENPYVAPVAKDAPAVQKYIPPSMRRPAASDGELLKQLRRQLQGLLNRLSEANLLSILQAVEDIYSKTARQHVTSTLVDLLVGLVSDPSALNDTFLILHAGFSAAVYKVIGTDFGAQLLEKLVGGIDRTRSSASGEGKQTLNMLAFLSCLYNFQLVGSAILFDYIRLLLEELSETNTELLLRIIRTSGQQLRQDDPSALKDIVLLLQRSTAQIGEEQLSVRTKFMIETIHNLKNNRMKTGVAGSTMAAEHNANMKKTLGSLNNNNTRSLRATEPLRISLSDIRDSEKKGKWWLIGASYQDPSKFAANTSSKSSKSLHDELDAGYESSTPGSVNLSRLARQQGMNTTVRRAIFIAILSSTDCEEAHMRVRKLHLKNKQMLEVPRVLAHCAAAEEAWNPFYALVARKFCAERRVRKAFMFGLWDVLRRVEGQGGDGEEEEEERLSVRQSVNMAKFFGFLIADQGLSVAVLKKLDADLLYSGGATLDFVEVLLTTVLLRLRKGGRKEKSVDYATRVQDVFRSAAGAGAVIPALKYVLAERVGKAELATRREEERAVEEGCEVAVLALEEAERAVPEGEVDNEAGVDGDSE